MKAEELRIGNWVIDPDGDYMQREELSPYCFSDTEYRWDWLKQLKPIPLTEEILLKAGFKKEKTGIGPQDMWAGMSAWSMKGEWLFRGNPTCLHLVGYYNTQIGYVHQLQNLFFELSGTELDIKL